VPLSQRVQLTLQDTQSKVSEGSTFLWRGLRLLRGRHLVLAAPLLGGSQRGHAQGQGGQPLQPRRNPTPGEMD